MEEAGEVRFYIMKGSVTRLYNPLYSLHKTAFQDSPLFGRSSIEKQSGNQYNRFV